MTLDATSAEHNSKTQNTWAELRTTLNRRWPQVRDFLIHGVGQVRILRKAFPGIMHFLIFWGMTIQILGTIVILMQIPLFIPLVELPFPRGIGYLAFELTMDLGGLAIIIGALMALYRRLILRPKSLESRWDDYFVLGLLLLITVVGFTVEGTRLLSVEHDWARWSPVGYLFAVMFRSAGITPQAAASVHYTLYWTHIVLGLSLVAAIPFTKLRHLVTAPLNVIMRARGKESALIPIENIEEAEILGVGKVSEFTPQQLLSFDACLRCGRCEDVCPASIAGMPLSPRVLMQDLRAGMTSSLLTKNGSEETEILGSYVKDETTWACTTCGACMMACPVFINPVSELIDLRRYQVLTTGQIPKSIADVLRNMERQGNPWGMPPEERTAWAENLGVRELAPGDETDVLLYLGCAFAFDMRNRKVAKSFIKLLQAAEVDFAVLGLDEACCGETARRLGHEYLFQVLAEQNIASFSEYNFNRIVTQCPHCFNTLKNEYPQFGGDYKVQHYTEYLKELLADRRLDLSGVAGKANAELFTFHDSCYLGRYNQIYTQPRELLARTGVNQAEMPRHEIEGFCCGGGGGQMWMETDPNTRINQRRLQEALDLGANKVATACPYCLIMFDDAIRSQGLGDEVQVLDVAEVMANRIEK